MEPINPISAKIASFFKFGAVSGEDLEQAKKETAVARSYDAHHIHALSLNCVSKIEGIKKSLLGGPANSGLSVVAEEAVGSGGIIDEALSRLGKEIEKYKEQLTIMGLTDRVSLESATLKNVISRDIAFRQNLLKKAAGPSQFLAMDLQNFYLNNILKKI